MLNKSISILISVLIGLVGVRGQERAQNITLSFTLSANNLPNMDIFNGRPDPYVILTLYNNKFAPTVRLGETSKLSNTNEANWTNVFNVNYAGGSTQFITFDLWDDDIGNDDFIGNANVTLYTIVTSRRDYINVPFNGTKAQSSRLIISPV